MRCRRFGIPHGKTTKMFFVVCILVSVIFALTVGFHDYLPEHPPTYLLLAEDKLKAKHVASIALKNKENVKAYGLFNAYATCNSAQAPPFGYASSINIINKGSNRIFKGFFSLAADLSPPSV